MKQLTAGLIGTFLALAAPVAAAPIGFVDLGLAGPPATVGTYTMTAFGADPQAFGGVTSVASPVSGDITFNTTLQHSDVGTAFPDGWGAPGNPYAGDVYSGRDGVTWTLPSGTSAFYFYVQAFVDDQTFALAGLNANGNAADTNFPPFPVITPINPQFPNDSTAGAQGFAFFAAPGETLGQIQLSTNSAFGIGEFGIAQTADVSPVPEPASMVLLGSGLVGAWAARRRRRA